MWRSPMVLSAGARCPLPRAGRLRKETRAWRGVSGSAFPPLRRLPLGLERGTPPRPPGPGAASPTRLQGPFPGCCAKSRGGAEGPARWPEVASGGRQQRKGEPSRVHRAAALRPTCAAPRSRGAAGVAVTLLRVSLLRGDPPAPCEPLTGAACCQPLI